MPTYDYQCRSCGYITEVVHSMLEDGPTVCERCGGPLRRVIHPTGIIFKGGGFYKTDSRASTSSASGGSGRGGSTGSGEATTPASSSTESKTPEAKTGDSGTTAKSTGGAKRDGGSG